MLLRLAFLESERRTGSWNSGQLARVHVFESTADDASGFVERAEGVGAMAFGWFVWHRDHDGPAIIDRISWKEATQ